MQHSDAHAVLGVDPSSSKRDIDAAYKALVLQHHPDMNPGKDECTFYSVQAAYNALTGGAGGATIPTRRTVPPGTQEHKVLTLRRPDGTTVSEQVWLRRAQDGRCNVFTSPYHDTSPAPSTRADAD